MPIYKSIFRLNKKVCSKKWWVGISILDYQPGDLVYLRRTIFYHKYIFRSNKKKFVIKNGGWE